MIKGTYQNINLDGNENGNDNSNNNGWNTTNTEIVDEWISKLDNIYNLCYKKYGKYKLNIFVTLAIATVLSVLSGLFSTINAFIHSTESYDAQLAFKIIVAIFSAGVVAIHAIVKLAKWFTSVTEIKEYLGKVDMFRAVLEDELEFPSSRRENAEQFISKNLNKYNTIVGGQPIDSAFDYN